MSLTVIEKKYSKPDLLIPVSITEEINESAPVSFNIIDKASSYYSKFLHEYDISEIIKSLAQRFGKNKQYCVLSKAGNLDLNDPLVGFHDFIVLLEQYKQTQKNGALIEDHLRIKATPIINYLLNGAHTNKEKVFPGWKRTFATSKKGLFSGILSIDLPSYVDVNKYICGGSQHYIAFTFDKQNQTLYLFDSATKNLVKEDSEVFYILKFAFEALMKGKTTTTIQVYPMIFQHILQPGAGDKHEEDEYSYNNQNVFCHTWSLWFLTLFICFYNPGHPEEGLQFISSLSHSSSLLNLAMIKRFALWLFNILNEEPIDTRKHFAVRAYQRAVEFKDIKRKNEVVSLYIEKTYPWVGLQYIYNYKNKEFISVEALCIDNKLKMDIHILDDLPTLRISDYLEIHAMKKCPRDKLLNMHTNRCVKPKVK